MITEAQVEKALHWLADSAIEIGAAREAMVRADHMLRHHRALAMKLSGESSIGAQEREALASEDYVMAVERAAVTAGEFETMKARREANALLIETWRSASANHRAMKL